MAKTTEEKVIENSELVISTAVSGVDNGNCLDEYSKLLKLYKKLAKKYDKVIKLGDKYSSKVMTNNDKLQTFTKKKVLESASSNRELKESFSEEVEQYKEIIERLKSKLKNNSTSANTITKELEVSRKETHLLKNKNIHLESKVKVLEEFNTPFEILLEQEIIRVRHNAEPMVLAILGIDDFAKIKNNINAFTTIDNFILGIFKYLQNSLKKSDTVVYGKNEIFYIMMPYTKMENAIKLLKIIGHRRVISQNNITLSSGVTSLNNDDTAESMIKRCLPAYKKAISDNLYSKTIEI